MSSKMQGLIAIPFILGLLITMADSQGIRYGVIRVNGHIKGNPVVQVNENGTDEFCFSYSSQLFNLPPEPGDKSYHLYDASSVDICDNPHAVLQKGNDSIFLIRREGNCSFNEYTKFVSESNGVGFFMSMFPREHINESYGLEVFGAVRNETIDDLRHYITWKNDVTIQLFTFEEVFFGGSIIFLWLTACLCVAIGSLTGPYQDLQSTSSRQQILDGSSSSSSEPKNVQIHFTVTLVSILVTFITGTLLLLYFFYDYLVYFFMAVFCFASGRATYEILTQIAHVFKFDACMPRIRGCGLHRIFLAGICVTLPLLWVIFRHSESIWILQDLLGICFCIHIIQTLRIPNLQICTVLLTSLFVYDIFFVFVTPYITSNGKSVMIEVATGGSSGETLPLLIKFPRYEGPDACIQKSYSLLGFGDIIVPGFLVCFAHSFDIIRGDKFRPYFITTLIGYAFGLSLAFIALYISQTGQPALLYIVPSALLAISITGLCRRQFRDLWRGSITITEVEP